LVALFVAPERDRVTASKRPSRRGCSRVRIPRISGRNRRVEALTRFLDVESVHNNRLTIRSPDKVMASGTRQHLAARQL